MRLSLSLGLEVVAHLGLEQGGCTPWTMQLSDAVRQRTVAYSVLHRPRSAIRTRTMHRPRVRRCIVHGRCSI